MDLELWPTLIFLFKWVAYVGTAAALGGPLSLLLFFRQSARAPRVIAYISAGCGIGALAAVANFFVQVGSFAEQGMRGMVDVTYINLLWQSDARTSLLAKLLGFSLITVSSWSIGRISHPVVWRQYRALLTGLLLVLGMASVAASYQYVGHAADASALARLAVFVHVLAMGFWIGSLYPLWLACRSRDAVELQAIMDRFSTIAVYVVAVLVVVGAALVIILVGDLFNLFTTDYGKVLLTKLALVCVLLVIAATNKWMWTPRLQQGATFSRYLLIAVGIEMIVALLTLLATAFMTTVTGPAL